MQFPAQLDTFCEQHLDIVRVLLINNNRKKKRKEKEKGAAW
jgi:hypothetical protein